MAGKPGRSGRPKGVREISDRLRRGFTDGVKIVADRENKTSRQVIAERFAKMLDTDDRRELRETFKLFIEKTPSGVDSGNITVIVKSGD